MAVPSGGTQPRLQAGQLVERVLAHLRDHPAVEFTAYELGKVLGRSHGTIHRILQRLTAQGTVTRTQDHPARYRITD